MRQSSDPIPSSVVNRLDHLRRLPRVVRLWSLVRTLDAAGDEELPAIASELLELALPPEPARIQAWIERRIRPLFQRWSPDRPRLEDDALRALAHAWARLPEDARAAARAIGAGHWSRVLMDAPTAPSPGEREGVAMLAADVGDAQLLTLVEPMLADPEGAVARAAEKALLALAIAAGNPDDSRAMERDLEAPPMNAERRELAAHERERVVEVIASAAGAYSTHRRRGVLHAAALLLDASRRAPGSPLGRWLREGDEESRHAFRGLLRWSKSALLRARAWELLARDDFASAAMDRLTRAGVPQEHDRVLALGHLTLRPARVRRVRSLGGRGLALPPRAIVPELCPEARRWLPRFSALHNNPSHNLSQTAGDAAKRPEHRAEGSIPQAHAMLEPLLVDPDPIVRHAAARHGPASLVEDLLFDHDPRVARAAFSRWSRVGRARDHSSAPTLRRLARSPHPALRTQALAELLARETDDSPVNRLAAREELLAHPETLLADIRLRLAGDVHADLLSTVLLIRRLELVPRFTHELARVAANAGHAGHEPMAARAIATAAAALAQAPGLESREALRVCLSAPEPRIRANAVEALARQSKASPERPGEWIRELKNDPHHRVRANSIRGMIQGAPLRGTPAVPSQIEPTPTPAVIDDALEALASMLSDDRPEHRLAAAWAASRLLPGRGRARLGPRWSEMVARVGELARFEDSPRVRRRAEWCVSRLAVEARTPEHAGAR